MYANLVLVVILWYFEIISEVFIWLQHNELYGLIDSECMHIPCHFMDKNGESFDSKMKKSPVRLVTCDKIYLVSLKEGDLYHNMMKFLQEC